MSEFIFNDYWSAFYLGGSLVALFASFRRGTIGHQKAAVLLWVSWLVTNILAAVPDRDLYYALADTVIAASMFWLWLSTRQPCLLPIGTLYAAMILVDITPYTTPQIKMLAGNVLYLAALLALIIGATTRGHRTDRNGHGHRASR